MFSLTSSNRFEYYAKPCDMRKGFDGLFGLVQNELGRNPLDGDVFVFMNKPRNTIKLLHWERDGLVIYHKRLEKGNFPLPQIEANKTQIRWPELVLMLEGITTTNLKRKPRFSLKTA
jgi:transposase